MTRPPVIPALLLACAAAVGSLAADATDRRRLDADIEDLDTLIYLVKERGRHFSWVDGLIIEVGMDVEDAAFLDEEARERRLAAIRRRRVELNRAWSESLGKRSDEAARALAVERMERAYEIAVQVGEELAAEIRRPWLATLLAEAKRLTQDGGEDARGRARELLARIIADPSVSEGRRKDAERMLVELDLADARRHHAAKDYTRAVDRLEEIHQRASRLLGSEDESVRRIEKSLEDLRRKTALIRVEPFDVGTALDDLPAEIVGELRKIGATADIHPIRDHLPREERVGSLSLPGRLRVSTEEGSDFELRVPRGDGAPPLRIPLRVDRRGLDVPVPNRVPARMAWVPDERFLIMLEELSYDGLNAVRERAGRPKATLPLVKEGEDAGRRPAGRIERADLDAVRRLWPSLRRPTERQWRRAALWIDGRPYPWGASETFTDRAAIDENDTWPVDTGATGPYGLHHAIGNVWEVLRNDRVIGGSKYSPGRKIELIYQDGTEKKTAVTDVVDTPYPLPGATDSEGNEEASKLKWESIQRWCQLGGSDDLIGVRFVIEIGEGR